jgi:hypothetical protein
LITAAPAPAEVPDVLQYFVGNWSCTTTMGNQTISSTSTGSQWGQWIRFSMNTPAQNGAGATDGTGYLGWDPQTKNWVYSEVDSDGTYFVTRSSTEKIGKSLWATVYPNNANTQIHVNGRMSYDLDNNWTQNGQSMSSHMACQRQ